MQSLNVQWELVSTYPVCTWVFTVLAQLSGNLPNCTLSYGYVRVILVSVFTWKMPSIPCILQVLCVVLWMLDGRCDPPCEPVFREAPEIMVYRDGTIRGKPVMQVSLQNISLIGE